MTPRRPKNAAGGGGEPTPDLSWRTIIDGWVKDPTIRRDVLIVLVAVLVALILIAWIVVAGGGTALSHLIGSALATTLGKIITGVGATGIGTGLWYRHRRRQAAVVANPVDLPEKISSQPAPQPDTRDPDKSNLSTA